MVKKKDSDNTHRNAAYIQAIVSTGSGRSCDSERSCEIEIANMTREKRGKRRPQKPSSDKRNYNQSQDEHSNNSTRKNLDPETVHYFSEISAHLEKSSTDSEERTIICSNALDECLGKELQLMCDKEFSRLFENLVQSCEKDQLCHFLLRCMTVFPAIAVHPSGSHVAEAALRSLALALQDCDDSGESYSLIEQVLTKLCETFSKDPVEVMCNQYGSHVIRSLLNLYNGSLLESWNNYHSNNLKTSLAQRVNPVAVEEPRKQQEKLVSHGFPHLLKSIISSILNCSKETLELARLDTFGSLVYQTVLKLVHEDEEMVLKVISGLFNCRKSNPRNKEKVLEKASVEDILNLTRNPSGSHLMEVVLEVAPDPLFMEILERFFRKSLFELAMHESGNFALQSLISNSREQGQVNIIWDEIGPKFSELLLERKGGVVASLISACQRFHTCERECCRALAQALNHDGGSSNSIVPRLLYLEDFLYFGRLDIQNASRHNISVLGCVMLQSIFNYSSKINQQFCTSFTSLDSTQILEIVMNSRGSRVIEAFLSSDAPSKNKFQIISKLQGHFGELAQLPFGSFTVSKCFMTANLALKEAIVSELVAVQTELARLKHGPHLLRVCDVSRFVREPQQWRACQNSKQSAREEFTEIFGSKDKGKRDGRVSYANKKIDVDNDIKRNEKEEQNVEDIMTLEHPMAQLGFPIDKSTKKNIKTDNISMKDGVFNQDADKITTKKKSKKRAVHDNTDELISTKNDTAGRKKPKSKGYSEILNIGSGNARIDTSLSAFLDIIEKGSSKKENKKNKDDNNILSTSSAKKQKREKRGLI